MGVFRAMGGSYGFKTSYYGLPEMNALLVLKPKVEKIQPTSHPEIFFLSTSLFKTHVYCVLLYTVLKRPHGVKILLVLGLCHTDRINIAIFSDGWVTRAA